MLLKAGQYKDRDGNEFPYSNINISVRRHLLGEIVGQSDAEFLDDLDDILEASQEMSDFSKSKFLEHIKKTSKDLLSGTIKDLLGPLSTKDFSLPRKVREVSLEFRTKEGTKQLEEPKEGEPQFSPLDTRTFEEYPEYEPSDLDLSEIKVEPDKRTKTDKAEIITKTITFNEIESLGKKGSKSKFLMSKGIRPTLETLERNIQTFDLIGPEDMDPKDVPIPKGKRKQKESRDAKKLYFYQQPKNIKKVDEIIELVEEIEASLNDFYEFVENIKRAKYDDAKSRNEAEKLGRLLREYYVLHQDYYSKAVKLKQTEGKDSTLDAKNAFVIFDIISESKGRYGKRGIKQITKDIKKLLKKLPEKYMGFNLKEKSNDFILTVSELITKEKKLENAYANLPMAKVPEEYFPKVTDSQSKYGGEKTLAAQVKNIDNSLEARLQRIFEREEREKRLASKESKVEKAEDSDDKIAEDIFEGKKGATKRLVKKYLRTDYDVYEYTFKIQKIIDEEGSAKYKLDSARAKIIGNLRPSIVPKERDAASYTVLETAGELNRTEKEQLYSALREIRINEEDLEDYLKEV